MYSLARKFLFRLDPELSHDLALDALAAAERLHLLKPFCPQVPEHPVEVMGLRFPNPVGLAAGLDKNADYVNALGQMGFGFVEIGTVTPKAQPGNPPPRMFRLVRERAIINRMGFNNKGVDHLVARVRQRRFKGVLGINIGKNKSTPEAGALADYQACMEKVFPYADYIAINISSPNTPGLRNLQYGERFSQLLAGIKHRQAQLSERHRRRVPIAVKIAPDMAADELAQLADTLLARDVEAVIATNTTLDRRGVENSPHRDEPGGLSGAPLTATSTRTIRRLAQRLGGQIPIIGVGGIMSGADAREKIDAGASLVQIYSGFIYRGPQLISDAVEAITGQKSAGGSSEGPSD